MAISKVNDKWNKKYIAIDLLENPVSESEGGTDKKSKGHIKKGKINTDKVI